jgi:hypothetical protein
MANSGMWCPFSGEMEPIIVRVKRELPSIDGTDLEKGAKRRRLKMAVEADPKC